MRTTFLSLSIFLVSSLIPVIPLHAATDGSLIKTDSNTAVYYLSNGKRYAFPNEKVFFSWYNGFSSVQIVSASELASYQLAGNVTYRPGSWLIKIQTDPKVYAVSKYGVLHWLTSESVAAELYGSAWNTKVHDVSDAFFTNYTLGTGISSATQFNVNQELAVTNIWQNISGGMQPTPNPTPTGGQTMLAGCQVFPADNAWNQDISTLPVHPKSAAYIASIGASKTLHPDFGENQDYGIPYNVVSGSQTKVPITWTAYGDESDPGPYPIPADAKREVSDDHHVLVLEKDSCTLYELYNAAKTTNGWSGDSGAIWHLNSNARRTEGWTSADAAGLPILPGLVRYEEVAAGKITHAIRFTVPKSQNGWIYPATHAAGQSDTNLPPMGLRVRLKVDYDISNLTGQARVIAQAMKTYGMINADNGSSWYFQGAPDPHWNDDELNQLKTIPGSAFEAVNTGEIHY